MVTLFFPWRAMPNKTFVSSITFTDDLEQDVVLCFKMGANGVLERILHMGVPAEKYAKDHCPKGLTAHNAAVWDDEKMCRYLRIISNLMDSG